MKMINVDILQENIINKYKDVFYVPIQYLNTDLNKFLNLKQGCITDISIEIVDNLKNSLDAENVEINTFDFIVQTKSIYRNDFKNKAIVFTDFFVPHFLKTKVLFSMSSKIKEDYLVKFEVGFCDFNDAFEFILEEQKIYQEKEFEIEYIDVYKKNKNDIMQYNIEKKYLPCSITMYNEKIQRKIID